MAGICINFNLQKINKTPYLYISVIIQGVRVRKILDFEIDENYWDKKKQLFKNSYTNASLLNAKLNSYRSQLIDFFNNFIGSSNNQIIKDEVKKAIEQVLKPKPKEIVKSFHEYFDVFINDSKSGIRLTESGKPLKSTTIRSYAATYNHLKIFEKLYNFKLEINEGESHFFSRFNQYCCQIGLSNHSIWKHCKIIKSFLHYTQKNKIEIDNGFINSFKIKKSEPTKDILSDEEIMRIENLNNLTPRLDRIRDLFLFQICTGVRQSDLAIRPENIDLNANIISLVTIKNQQMIKIPLINRTREILNKYNNKLPRLSGQKYNEGIHELCKCADICSEVQVVKFIGKNRIEESKPKYELISSHTARRIFVTRLLKRGLIAEDIMKITGHANRTSFQRYVILSQEDSINNVRNALDAMNT
ncbi:MAG: tyrosine-type recombinase/integrase [Candidatus Kapabacteria bacterium]|nr:tyrosine-type recombinase/integrase [Candidatus Kapabacteria bacterium]